MLPQRHPPPHPRPPGTPTIGTTPRTSPPGCCWALPCRGRCTRPGGRPTRAAAAPGAAAAAAGAAPTAALGLGRMRRRPAPRRRTATARRSRCSSGRAAGRLARRASGRRAASCRRSCQARCSPCNGGHNAAASLSMIMVQAPGCVGRRGEARPLESATCRLREPLTGECGSGGHPSGGTAARTRARRRRPAPTRRPPRQSKD
jgi:hypothetical protein